MLQRPALSATLIAVLLFLLAAPQHALGQEAVDVTEGVTASDSADASEAAASAEAAQPPRDASCSSDNPNSDFNPHERPETGGRWFEVRA
jgi:hypothetical protein